MGSTPTGPVTAPRTGQTFLNSRPNERKPALYGRDLSHPDGRPAKRPRLSPWKRPKDVENAVHHSQPHAAAWPPAPMLKMSKDEQAMMDDLLAGLDASTFDMSPTRSQTVKTGSQVKAEPLSPLKSRSGNMSQRDRNALEAPTVEVKLEKPKRDRLAVPTVVPLKVEIDILPEIAVKSESSAEDDDLLSGLDDLCEFDFGDLSAFEEDLYQPPPPAVKYPIANPHVPPPPDGYTSTPWLRCTVEFVYDGIRFVDGVIPQRSVLESLSVAAGPGIPVGKTLVCNTPKSNSLQIVHLKEAWMMAAVRAGDTINVITPCLNSPITISSRCPSSYLILHPDLMITMTSIANAMPCPRRPILNSLIKTSGPQTKAVVYGNLLHGLLQAALQEQDFSAESTQSRLEGMLKREDVRLDVWGAGLNVRDVAQDLGDRAREGFKTFGGKWVGKTPADGGELHSMPGDSEELLAISGLHEVEEDIWSPKWGLKGKVDASVQAAIVRKIPSKPKGPFAPKTNPKAGDAEVTGDGEVVAPLEIKTGRAVGLMAHRAQTMLYTLLMEDRYGVPVPAGLLYYSQLDTILRVEAKTNEIRSLIIARNELASYLNKKRKIKKAAETSGSPRGVLDSKRDMDRTSGLELADMEDSFLPPTLDNERECKNCYAKDACMLYRKAVDKTPITANDPIGLQYEETVGNISDADTAFFRKWETLLTVEEQDMARFKSQLWTMSAEDREQNGRCFANMVIDPYSNDIGKSLAKIHRHAYTFVRAAKPAVEGKACSSASAGSDKISLLSGHIAKGDPVSLSIEPDLFALARGYVLELTPTSVTVGVQQVIDPSALLQRTKYRHASRQLSQAHNHATETSNDVPSAKPVIFRIDKDEMSGGVARMRNNLAQLFLPGGNEKLRRIVVDHVAPRFGSLAPDNIDDPYGLVSQGPLASLPDVPAPESFNSDQRLAMQRVLSAQDYALILGMPGTGKTTTIAEIIKAIIGRGQTVLLASYTHSAVDTIVRKLVNEDIGMLRLGNVDKVHPDVQHLTLEAMNASTSMGELGERLMGPPVVACTCLGIDHPLFQRRKFDYCIIDEASQITLPTALGPLRFADKFVLVGDHYQLPPIVKNHNARKAGLDVSLFKMLSDARPESVTSLTFQYRMNEDIMALSNRLIYEGRLKCGSEEVAKQGLVLRKPTVKKDQGAEGVLCNHDEVQCWIGDLMQDEVKAVFVDTDAVPARDTRVGDLVQNPTEALLARQFAGALTEAGIRQDDIAVITPYRQQIKLLSGLCQDLARVEILTADKSQGRDKDVIIISLVRSNESGNIGELLRDWRRINVSFTRAKKKLVIFGSKSTLMQDKLLSGFFDLMEEKQWIYRLGKGAHAMLGHAAAQIKATE